MPFRATFPVFPHRIMVDIAEMIEALDKVTPGIASDETAVRRKSNSIPNKVVVDKDFCTSVKGLAPSATASVTAASSRQAQRTVGCEAF